MSIARKIVEFAINSDSSDIHIEENKEIALRINSDIEILENIINSEDMDSLLDELLGPEKLEIFKKTGDLKWKVVGWVAASTVAKLLSTTPKLWTWVAKSELGAPVELGNFVIDEKGSALCVGLPFLISLIDTVTGSVASFCEKYKSTFVAKQPPGLLTLNDCAKFINAIFLPFLYLFILIILFFV